MKIMNQFDLVLVATTNQGKVKEIKSIMEEVADYQNAFIGLENNVTTAKEDGDTIEDNSKIKALYYGHMFNMPTITDDSGIFINLLGGYPGVRSAEIVKNNNYEATFSDIYNAITDKLQQPNNTEAEFRCAISFYVPNHYIKDASLLTDINFTEIDHGLIKTATGVIKGKLQFPPSGKNGFGYDPIFIPNGSDLTFAQMESGQKSLFSHRYNAIKNLYSL